MYKKTLSEFIGIPQQKRYLTKRDSWCEYLPSATPAARVRKIKKFDTLEPNIVAGERPKGLNTIRSSNRELPKLKSIASAKRLQNLRPYQSRASSTRPISMLSSKHQKSVVMVKEKIIQKTISQYFDKKPKRRSRLDQRQRNSIQMALSDDEEF